MKNPNSSQPTDQRPPTPAHHTDTNRRRVLTVLTVLILIAISGYFLYPKLNSPAEVTTLDKSIAVLPFADLSSGKDLSWFSDGLTEEILNSLTQVEDLSVIARTSSFAFKDKNLPIKRIADSLGVNYVVEGSVRRANDQLRITAQLSRAADGFNIWSHSYDYTSADFFKVQREIASQIAASLGISLDPATQQKMQWAGTTNPDAFLAFLRGVDLYEEFHWG